MRIYSSIEELAAALGMKLNTNHRGGLGFEWEADWGYRLSGQGQPGGIRRGGWLVTRAQYSSASQNGHLIAYEIDAKDAKTGRCALLRTPWPADLDNSELARVQASPGWTSRGAEGEMNIDDLDAMLAGERI